MQLIPLTQGFSAIVDEEDFEWLSQWRWSILICKTYPQWHYSAARNTRQGGIYMHRAIIQAPRGIEVDHVNGYSLDNRRANLRLATKSQNQGNRYAVRAASGFRGVRWHAKTGAWQARICVNYHHLALGYYSTARAAAEAVDAALVEHFGPYARTNASLGKFE